MKADQSNKKLKKMSEQIQIALDFEGLSAEIFDSIDDQQQQQSLEYDLEQAVAREEEQQQQTDYLPSLEELLDQTDVSELIQSLLSANLPAEHELEPPSSSTPIIDPTLNPSSPPPITLSSAPHSPQPSLRSDASTSQLPLTKPKPSSLLTPANIKIYSLDQLANPPLGQQPNYPWWTILRAAIMGSPHGILNREEIYEALTNRWEYFRSTSDSATRVWKSAVGHNLSVKECFVRVHVQGKKNTSYYIVDTAVDPAKGRLSKAKNSISQPDKMSIPTITRKLVLPPDFDLSIQARWSPAIAAIRNTKYGYPTPTRQAPQTQQTSNSKEDHHHSKSDHSSETDTETETETEDDTSTETEPTNTPQRSITTMTGGRLGSSLSAIIGQPITNTNNHSSCRINNSNNQPIPRLAFSRSLSNALVPAHPPSRRRTLAARNSSSSTPNPPPRNRASNHSCINQASSTSNHNLSTLRSRPIPAPPKTTTSQPSPSCIVDELSSLQDHVNAALADVAASLPKIVPLNQEYHHQEQAEELHQQREEHRTIEEELSSIAQQMMIDIHSSILDPLPASPSPIPEIDFESLLKQAHDELQNEEEQQILNEPVENQNTTTETETNNEINNSVQNMLDDLIGREEENEDQVLMSLMMNLDEEDSNQKGDDDEVEVENGESLVPTAADFDRLLASVIDEHGDDQSSTSFHDEAQNADQQLIEANLTEDNTGLLGLNKRSIEEAGLTDFLQDLIDQAQHEHETDQIPEEEERLENVHIEEEEGNGFMEASRMLENEIEEALKKAEEQEMNRARRQREIQQEEEEEAARVRERLISSRQIEEERRLNLELNTSGDIPVHPLPLSTLDIPTTSSSISSAHPRTTSSSSATTTPTSRSRLTNNNRSRTDRRNNTNHQNNNPGPGSSRPSSNRPAVNRPTLLRCLPNPLNSSTSTTNSSTTRMLDRRTRASGARTIGRKLNLPLPSSHTLPTEGTEESSSSNTLHIDDNTLAPGFLDSLNVISTEKPRATFPELAKDAILAHPSGKLTAAEIFRVLEKKYPYFVSAADSWKATLRNVLTSHSCFVKIPRPADAPGRGDWWATVDLPLWKRRRTTAKAKQDEDFIGRHARELSRRQQQLQLKSSSSSSSTPTPSTTPLTTTATTTNSSTSVSSMNISPELLMGRASLDTTTNRPMNALSSLGSITTITSSSSSSSSNEIPLPSASSLSLPTISDLMVG
ncbi:hypothetical protein MJO28_015724 [Puccinia striiformis f. sp. tritici]|uniref:Uncharacterized protein n=1 Tax=Puccinia striiformis f. sp. tritici TaxID=168172 RepID=A0ACC0DRG8_9BASI|nr:hypothetical protein MJO28_015724 [Puccinia striiformis f. sp. tritici]